ARAPRRSPALSLSGGRLLLLRRDAARERVEPDRGHLAHRELFPTRWTRALFLRLVACLRAAPAALPSLQPRRAPGLPRARVRPCQAPARHARRRARARRLRASLLAPRPARLGVVRAGSPGGGPGFRRGAALRARRAREGRARVRHRAL